MKLTRVVGRTESDRHFRGAILKNEGDLQTGDQLHNNHSSKGNVNHSYMPEIAPKSQVSTVMEAANYAIDAITPKFTGQGGARRDLHDTEQLLTSNTAQSGAPIGARGALAGPSASFAGEVNEGGVYARKDLEDGGGRPVSEHHPDSSGGGVVIPMAADHFARNSAAALATRASRRVTIPDEIVNGTRDSSLNNNAGFRESNRSSVSRRPPSSIGMDRSRKRVFSMTSQSSTGTSRGSTISFHNINYVVKSKQFPWSKQKEKSVLTNVSGIMKPGMNAIMGPTGSGKSSLLDVLAGRKDPKFLEGEVLIDGALQPKNFKCISGYVVQDDIVMGTLTVKENLTFSAVLRLPGYVKPEDRKKKVDNIIEELGLTAVANSKIGTELIRGVSGGERKRANIGIELITDPSVLFLDEPTTGLDASTAASVIKLLRRLSQRGRTIIFSIHQPKYTIYKLFDTLTIVFRGEIVYQGHGDNGPLDYFRNFGYICEAHNNPADFLMDILHGEAKPVDYTTNDKWKRRPIVAHRGSENASLSDIEAVIEAEPPTTYGTKLLDDWKRSTQYDLIKAEVDQIYSASQIDRGDHMSLKKGRILDYHTSFLLQLRYVSWRTFINLVRNPQSSIIMLAVHLLFCLVIGIVYFGLDLYIESGIENRRGLFFFVVLMMTFINLANVEVFIKERPLFIHENSSGFYRVSVYFLTKVFCDLLPMKALAVFLAMPIVYWMAKLRNDSAAFFFFELVIFLASVAGGAVSFFVSASVSILGIANLLVSISYVFMMVFSGFLVNNLKIAGWLNWCKYFSVFHYSTNAMSVNEFKYLSFCMRNYTHICEPGNFTLTAKGINYKTDWDLWSNILGIVLISIVLFALCYMQLRLMNKRK